LNEVAELAGMPHAGVLHHFGSSDQLSTAVLEYRDRDVMDLEGQHIPAPDEVDLVETTRFGIEAILTATLQGTALAESLTAATGTAGTASAGAASGGIGPAGDGP
jgi:AcrR family transcriptional regulator